MANNAFIDLYSLLNSPDYKDDEGGLTDENRRIQKMSHGNKVKKDIMFDILKIKFKNPELLNILNSTQRSPNSKS